MRKCMADDLLCNGSGYVFCESEYNDADLTKYTRAYIIILGNCLYDSE